MPEFSSWQDLLKMIISDPSERARIAQLIDVHMMTLTRWAHGTSTPRTHNLHQLLQVLSPDIRKQFSELLGPLNPDPESLSVQKQVGELDVHFIMEICQARETTPEILHFYGICNLIFQHALRLLDPERIGMSITLVRCTPPSSHGKVHSLRENMSRGTSPTTRNVQEHPVFLGAESLAGYVVDQCRPQVIRANVGSIFSFTSLQIDEGSIMGCPILYANRVAGCLLFFSKQSDYFQLPTRYSLITALTHLISLAFKPDEFYPMEAIELFVMPPPEQQQQWLVSFRPRVMQMMHEASQAGLLLTVAEAEEHVWQQLEALMIETSRQLFSVESST